MPPLIQKPQAKRWVKQLIFGDVGVGKTRFLGTCQQDERTAPAVILDFEGGTSTLSGLDIDVIRIRDWDDYDKAFSWLYDEMPYKTVCLDSVTETHVYALLTILDQEAAERTAKGQATDQLQQADYGRALIQMRKLLRAFRDLECHVIFTALPQEAIEPGLGVVKKPNLAGKLADEIPGLMDVVTYLTWAAPDPKKPREEARLLAIKNYPRFKVKARTPWNSNVPDEIWDPTMAKFLDAIGLQ